MINKTKKTEHLNKPKDSLTLSNENIHLEIKKIPEGYEINYKCDINGEVDNEIYIYLDGNNLDYKKVLETVFEEGYRICFYDSEQNTEFDVGLSVEENFVLYFGLIDYLNETIYPAKTYNYKMIIDKTDKKFEKFDLLINLIFYSLTKKVSDGNEHQPNSIKYPRPSRF